LIQHRIHADDENILDDNEASIEARTWELIDRGYTGSQTQKGIVTYAVSPNRQDPMAGAVKNAVFNTYRRTYHQILYWLPPLVLGYVLMDWATER
jgi:hypothetical protein